MAPPTFHIEDSGDLPDPKEEALRKRAADLLARLRGDKAPQAKAVPSPLAPSQFGPKELMGQIKDRAFASAESPDPADRQTAVLRERLLKKLDSLTEQSIIRGKYTVNRKKDAVTIGIDFKNKTLFIETDNEFPESEAIKIRLAEEMFKALEGQAKNIKLLEKLRVVAYHLIGLLRRNTFHAVVPPDPNYDHERTENWDVDFEVTDIE